jgi:MFS family permease
VTLGIAVWVIVLPLSLVLIRRPEDVGLKPDGDPPEDVETEDMPAKEIETSDVNSSPAAKEVDWTLRQVFSSRTFWILTAAFFLSSLAHSMVTVHANNHIQESVNMSPKWGAFFGVGLWVGLSLIGRLLFGWLGDFWDKRYLFMIAYVLCGLGVLVLSRADSLFTAVLYAVLFGIGFGATIPLSPAIRGEYFGREAFGKIQGFTAPIMMLGGMTGPLVAGFLYDLRGAYTLSFTLVAVMQFLAAFTIFFARRTQPPELKMTGPITPK